jgi:hypothetical protein
MLKDTALDRLPFLHAIAEVDSVIENGPSLPLRVPLDLVSKFSPLSNH